MRCKNKTSEVKYKDLFDYRRSGLNNKKFGCHRETARCSDGVKLKHCSEAVCTLALRAPQRALGQPTPGNGHVHLSNAGRVSSCNKCSELLHCIAFVGMNGARCAIGQCSYSLFMLLLLLLRMQKSRKLKIVAYPATEAATVHH